MIATQSLLIIACVLVSNSVVNCGNHNRYQQQNPSHHQQNPVAAVRQKQSIVDVLVKNKDRYSTLITAVQKVELVDTLSNGGPFTLFAPTNDAFAALPDGALAKLLASPEDLKNVLLGHVSSGSYPVALIRSGDLPSLNGVSNKIALSETGVTVSGIKVIGNELIADNGVIHTIERVILPQPSKPQSIVDILIKNEATYSTLITAVKAVELVETLSTGGPFTLFAPTNDAFAALPEGALAKLLAVPEDLKKVLLGHVASGNLPVALVRSGDLATLSGSSRRVYVSADGVKIDAANVIGNEFIASNGVIHTIDKVLS